MAEGRKRHPLRQVMPHPRGTDDGIAQLRALGLQEGELLELLSALPLRHLLGTVLCRNLSFKESDLSGKAIDILTSRG
jgi:hypothetical protein